ncbi:hypothetical protein ATANTOWER_005846 [Ataeniobius toweri]|uniref:Uncharacterized protein n=1 Tax=Ataeniobius toweri TaxID=208326 RepID=A0ABU7A6H2_9TELE|nr:hypothetical protein [Ataeniobius toweri]
MLSLSNEIRLEGVLGERTASTEVWHRIKTAPSDREVSGSAHLHRTLLRIQRFFCSLKLPEAEAVRWIDMGMEDTAVAVAVVVAMDTDMDTDMDTVVVVGRNMDTDMETSRSTNTSMVTNTRNATRRGRTLMSPPAAPAAATLIRWKHYQHLHLQ